MNRLVLSAAIVERSAVRYTPAGLPALDLVLEHRSDVEHEGHVRKLALQIRALAIGSISAAAAGLALGSPAQFAGFLAATRNGRGLLFHLTEIVAPSAP